jgi:hypothetical protein
VWVEIPESTVLFVDARGEVEQRPFKPAVPASPVAV